MNNVDRPNSDYIPIAGYEPPRAQQAVWRRETPPLPVAELLKSVQPNLTIHSFLGAIEGSFESLKELENLIDQEKKSPSEAGLKLIRDQFRRAGVHLSIISEAIKDNEEFRRIYGKTVDMLQYRLSRLQETSSLQNTSILRQLLDDVRPIFPEVIPDQLPEDYLGLMELGKAVKEEALAYAKEKVNPSSPLSRFSRYGENLSLIKRFVEELEAQKKHTFEGLLAHASNETRAILEGFEALAGYIPLDQKWVVYHLVETNPVFTDYNPETKEETQKSVRAFFGEILEIAKAEKRANAIQIENDEYSRLSPELGKRIGFLSSELLNICDPSKASIINHELTAFSSHLMQRVGSLNNSQPVTDSLSTVYGNYSGKTAKRYYSNIVGTPQAINAYGQYERDLIREGFLERDDLGFWVRNQYFIQNEGRTINWKGTFDFTCADGRTCRAEAVATIDLTPLAWLHEQHLQAAVELAETVASLPEERSHRYIAVSIEHPEMIPQELRTALLDDSEFWKRVQTKKCTPEDADTLKFVIGRYDELESILKDFSLSLNKQLRKIYFESSQKTAVAEPQRMRHASTYTRSERLGFAARWAFSRLGKTLKNAFRTSKGKRVFAEQVSASLQQFNPQELLKQNQLPMKLISASSKVRAFYEAAAATVARDNDKEALLDLLNRIEEELSGTAAGATPVFAVINRSEELETKRIKLQEQIDSLADDPFRPAKAILDQYLDSTVDEVQKHLDETVKEITANVEKFIHPNIPNVTFTENQRKILIANTMINNVLAKRVERIALSEMPFEVEDYKVIQQITTFPINMVDPIEVACRVPELRPILSRYLKMPSFKDSLDVLSSRPREQRLAVQRRFIEDCLATLATLPDSNTNITNIELLNKSINYLK